MPNESTFVKLVKKHLPLEVDWQRIETGGTGTGIPDVNICYNGQEHWIEFKIVKGRSVDLSPMQIAWHSRRTKAGGRTWIIARHTFDGPRIGKGDRIYLWPGRCAKEVMQKGISYSETALGHYQWESPFPWPKIMEAILK